MNVVDEIRKDWDKEDHINGRVLGNTNDIKRDVTWFVLSDGRVISFHKAYLNAHPFHTDEPKTAVFYSDNETFASVTAQNLGIEYYLLVNASDDEAEKAIADLELEVKDRISI